jgi:hypothetical protein
MSIVAGLLSLGLGLAYVGLGTIAAYELVRHRASRGFSPFGTGLLMMAATCGPHHLMHAAHHLLQREAASSPMVAALALAFAPGVVFVFLRVEAAFGGRGDRLVAGSPLWLAAFPVVVLAAGGVTLFEAFELARLHGFHLAGLVPSGVLFVNYLLVGVFTGRTQLARRPVLGGWSLSGVAMSGVFATCAIAHLAAGLTLAPDFHTLTLDNLGVPASLYFLWVVHRLHRASLRDWNRAPLVGRAAPLGRSSPWAAAESNA